MGTKVKLTDVRLFFPDLFTAVEFKKDDGKPRFNASFGVLKTDAKQVAAIEAAIKAEAQVAWPKDWAKQVENMRSNPNKFALTDGDKKSYDGAEGYLILSAHRKAQDGRPYVIDGKKTPLVESDGKIYSGCYVNASVEIWAQTGENAGIRCGLLGVQFNRDGDSFSGASKPNPDDFDVIEEGANDGADLT